MTLQTFFLLKRFDRILPVSVYCQGELSELGKNIDSKNNASSLLQFVKPESKNESDRLKREIEEAKNIVRDNLRKTTQKWRLESEKYKLSNQQKLLQNKLDSLTKSLPPMSKDDDEKMQLYNSLLEFENKRIQAKDHANKIVTDFKKIQPGIK